MHLRYKPPPYSSQSAAVALLMAVLAVQAELLDGDALNQPQTQ
jgi:hypothetical protein